MRAFRSNGQAGLEALTMVELPDSGDAGSLTPACSALLAPLFRFRLL